MSPTISFNVGGSIFQVRRSLLEEFPSTVLALSASEVWHDEKSENEPIFIDRDAGRFRYCLDFMRDGKVHLPHTESKEALLKDLEYYGFHGVDPGSIVVDFPLLEAAKCVEKFQTEMNGEIVKAESELMHLKLARGCLDVILKTRDALLEKEIKVPWRDLSEDYRNAVQFHLIDMKKLSKHLKKYKLRAVGQNFKSSDVYYESLTFEAI